MNNLIDAQEMAQKHPDTFEAPTTEELNEVKEGSFVKICNGEERFWATVTKISVDKVTADVDNDLLGDYGYNLGDEIEFEKKHIYSIF